MAEGRKKWPAVADDWFVEPPAATQFLLEREVFHGAIWDPSCGQGNIVTACRDAGLSAFGSDIRERAPGAPWFLGVSDFMDPEIQTSWAPNIICNPPYGRAKLAEAFIRKAVTLPGCDKVAMFVNAKFLFGSGRAQGLYRDHPPRMVRPVWPRPSCPPGTFLEEGGKAEGGVENFCWLVWGGLDVHTEVIWS